MSLFTEEGQHVTSILNAVASAMAGKDEGQRYRGDRLGVRLVEDIKREVQIAAASEDFSDLSDEGS